MKKGVKKPTWEERLRLVSRALGGTAGGTRILSRSGGWRGVCNAKGNTGLGGFYTFKLFSRIVVRLKVKQSNLACDNKGNRMRFIMKKK